MVESNAGEYDLVWTPEFAEEVLLAVEYVQNHLKPIAARNLLKGIEDVLDARRTMPQATIKHTTPAGTEFYVASYKRWNIYYVVEGQTVKAVALKHQLQK